MHAGNETGKGAQLAPPAGCSIRVDGPRRGICFARACSCILRKVLADCRATIGQVGNVGHENIKLGKAGRSRWKGRMPHNRGVTMNPVDHPLGGGVEGRASSGGRHPVSPWGQTDSRVTKHVK
ncbi:MAG: hypothetical protein R3C68_12990 [Myxococcota bacterium]